MEFEMTKGFIMFAMGIGGMAAVLLAALVAAILLRRSRKKLLGRLDGIYKE